MLNSLTHLFVLRSLLHGDTAIRHDCESEFTLVEEFYKLLAGHRKLNTNYNSCSEILKNRS